MRVSPTVTVPQVAPQQPAAKSSSPTNAPRPEARPGAKPDAKPTGTVETSASSNVKTSPDAKVTSKSTTTVNAKTVGQPKPKATEAKPVPQAQTTEAVKPEAKPEGLFEQLSKGTELVKSVVGVFSGGNNAAQASTAPVKAEVAPEVPMAAPTQASLPAVAPLPAAPAPAPAAPAAPAMQEAAQPKDAAEPQSDLQSSEPVAKEGKSADTPKSATGGTDSSRQTYNDLKSSANADGKVSNNEQKALDMYAKKFAVQDSPTKGLDQVLKDLLSASMEDGQISDNEAKAISSVVDAMGGKTALGKSDVMDMLSQFMKGAEGDNNFSDQDLATFGKLLSLADGGSDAAGGASGGGASSRGEGSRGNTSPGEGGSLKMAADVSAPAPAPAAQKSSAAPGWQNMQSLLGSYLNKSDKA